MPSRRWWIVVVLAAVFSMHGVVLVTTAGDAPAVAAQHAMAGPATVVPLSDAASGFLAGPAVDAVAAAEEPMQDTDPGHGVGAHLWSLCLAILAGLTLLGALVLTARVSAANPATVGSLTRRARRWPGPPRPPDLARLCLLRI